MLGLGASEFVHKPFKSRVLVSHSPLALPDISPTGFQSYILWKIIFLVQDPRIGSPTWSLDPSLLGGTPAAGDISPLVVAAPGVPRPCVCPSYPYQCGLFFISSVIENLFCSSSDHSQGVVVLYVVVVLCICRRR